MRLAGGSRLTLADRTRRWGSDELSAVCTFRLGPFAAVIGPYRQFSDRNLTTQVTAVRHPSRFFGCQFLENGDHRC